MKRDYPRGSCKACPIEKECTALREGWSCATCKETLVCGAKGALGRNNCDFVRRLWLVQPTYCLFVRGVLRQQNIEPEALLQESRYDSTYGQCFLCPRCGLGRLRLNSRSTQPSHMYGYGKDDSSYVTNAMCRFCGLDVTHRT